MKNLYFCVIKKKKNNGYPINLFENCINKFLDRKYSDSNSDDSSPLEKQYISLPYFGSQSNKLKQELSSSLQKFFPNKSFHIILVNPFKIGNFFRFKDTLPSSNIVLLILESLHIFHKQPKLNDMSSAFPLHIINRRYFFLFLLFSLFNLLGSPIFQFILMFSLYCRCNFLAEESHVTETFLI